MTYECPYGCPYTAGNGEDLRRHCNEVHGWRTVSQREDPKCWPEFEPEEFQRLTFVRWSLYTACRWQFTEQGANS